MTLSILYLSVHAVLAIAMLTATVIHVEEDRPVLGLCCSIAGFLNVAACGIFFLERFT